MTLAICNMEKFKTTTIDLSWPALEGKFEAQIVNGAISSLLMCETGQTDPTCGKCLSSVDIKFLKSVHTALSELFKAIDEEQKSNGHSFSKETV